MDNERIPEDPASETGAEIYSLTGVDPEVHAYAMAKYSRSALSMRQSLRELSRQRAEQFLNTFYFQYGHRSIADLAHLSFAIERLSMLAAIAVLDEQKWDGQERSSRYQDFRKSGYYIPKVPATMQTSFVSTANALIAEYEALSQRCFEHFSAVVQRPPEMPDDAYRRTLKARAFDVARFLLPLATITSVGQIVNARVLENQIARLASDPHPEIRAIALGLRKSALTPPYDLKNETLKGIVEQLAKAHPEVKFSALRDELSNPPLAPTLVKYANARKYDTETKQSLRQAAKELLGTASPSSVGAVTLVEPPTIEIEISATLLYEHSDHSYQDIVNMVSDFPAKLRTEIIELGAKFRGQFDEISRPYSAGQQFQFDILMDIGGFRDLHRHRRCTQILQSFTVVHDYVIPELVDQAGRAPQFRKLMGLCADVWTEFKSHADPDVASSADYILPLAYKRRALFKMDYAEALYICELRTGPAGHFSYRRVAYDMYMAMKQRHPELASLIRVHDVNRPVDLLQR